MNKSAESEKQIVISCKDLFILLDKHNANDALNLKENIVIGFLMSDSGNAFPVNSHSIIGIQSLRVIDEYKAFEAYLNNLFGIEECWDDKEERVPYIYEK